MTSKMQPAADYWTVDLENLGTRLLFLVSRKTKSEWQNSFKNGEIFWNISASVDNTLHDLQNSSYPTKAKFNNC